MLTLKNKNAVYNHTRCVQCGACLAACDHSALSAELCEDGLNWIKVDTERCTGCGQCVGVCPAHRLPNMKLTEDSWRNIQKTVLVCCRDKRIRYRASSGGAARSIISGALDSGMAECAYTLKRSPEYPWAEGCLYTPPVNMDEIPNSMYLPILAMKNLRINRPITSILLVGTTCQLLAADRLLKNRVENIIKVAILCKQQKTWMMSKFVAKSLGIRDTTNGINYISFRGNGWPGRTEINGGKMLSWEDAAALPYGKRLWRVPGCLSCPNPLGVDVDLTLADPWGIEKPGTLGKTMAMAWSAKGMALLESNPGLILEGNLPLQTVRKSIGWEALKHRQHLVDYYAQKPVAAYIKLAGQCEKIQTKCYETFLERLSPPPVLRKVMSHFPDLPNWLLKMKAFTDE